MALVIFSYKRCHHLVIGVENANHMVMTHMSKEFITGIKTFAIEANAIE